MVAITAACTCTVDGWSGFANTRYNGYSFTGCGAHVDYHYQGSGAGYERTWCYVTSPPDCPGESPYIPEGFKTDNTLPEWEARGAAWKECYDGYRCEAWWGSLEGSPEGEPVMLDAPLDWPDCCALCSDSNRGDGDADGTANITAACVAWSFDPSTGLCQRMSAVESTNSESWGVNSTVHGFPGYFEAPITDCWGRGQYDLCVNTNMALIIPAVIVAVLSFLYIVLATCHTATERTSAIRDILDDSQARLVKAACVSVTCLRVGQTSAKGRTIYSYNYQGTFITRAGALFTIRPVVNRRAQREHHVEDRMLSVLFAQNLRPTVAGGCETPNGLRSEFLKMLRRVPKRPVPETRSGHEQSTTDRPFGCLLLMRGPDTSSTLQKATLVGILGEDRITCINPEVLGLNSTPGGWCFCPFLAAAAALIIMCITLLTNDAAQNMAAYTFAGNHRVGAVVGLVLCVLIPLVWCARHRYYNRKISRVFDESTLVAETELATTAT